ncbi:MAG: PBP1A family penicillin-binding protein [Candidatus Lindowbacteria bacterium]|nr:PBP1A family penicillin-binding protein [Candidatus Lindowbacteria bacterium]
MTEELQSSDNPPLRRLPFNPQHVLFLVLAGGLFGAACGMSLGLSRDLPQITNLATYKPMLSSVIYSCDGQVIADLGIQRRQPTSLSQIPLHLQQAIIAVEDQSFYRHLGLNPAGILRAAFENLRAGRVVQGGSTITQQLARNLFLTQRRDLGRKLREAILAIQIERRYTKKQILEMYLNQIYLGHGAYGVEEASRLYFGKHVEDLTVAQSALLAALPKAPTRFSPKNNPSAALKRRNLVLEMMSDEGYLTREQCISAKFEPIVLTARFMKDNGGFAPYFVEYVRQRVIETYGYDMLYKGGLQIYTTLDYKTQQAADEAIADGLRKYDRQHGIQSAELYDDAEAGVIGEGLPDDMMALKEAGRVPQEMATNVAQAALVAIDPHTGEIRAMVGGRDFDVSEFNRAVQARRQPGSGFKPFVWATAIESGMTASDKILDAPIVFHYGDKVWRPGNYDNEFHGRVTLRRALEESRNIVSIRLMSQLGVAPVSRLAWRTGIKSPLQPNLSLALGSSGVTLLEITSAYSTFASNGIYREPESILKITSPDGEIIEEKQPKERIAISEQTAYIMTTLMEGVIKRGTGRAALEVGRPAAGKTGTTNNYTDAWFIGYTPQIVAGVWIGYDDLRSLGEKQTGGRIATPIWAKFMKTALANKPAENFAVPKGIDLVDVEPDSGLLAPPGTSGKLIQAFQSGTAPTKYYDASQEQRVMDAIDASLPRRNGAE